MKLEALTRTAVALRAGEEKIIYVCDRSVTLSVLRPVKPSKTLKRKYDPKRNVQIFMEKEGKKFKPTHLRILLDLHLKRITNEKEYHVLHEAIEQVYKGEDPENHRTALESLKFSMWLDSAYTNLCLAQLFMMEQETNRHEEWKVEPPRAYLMGYIRLINEQTEEISQVLWNATRYKPPEKFLTPPV